MSVSATAINATSRFPNWLALPERATGVTNRPLTIAMLLLLALVPRWMMAERAEVLCPDAAFYIEVAQGLEDVDKTGPIEPREFNFYPVTLMLMHRAGLDWETAAKLWGVTCGTLMILPLFGWIRRQFDDRTATIGCALIAIHPKLLQWTPEMVRDPTFCLWVATSVYLTWRAVTELRWIWFVAAGIATSLAIQTRFEGWFLFVPLFIWAGWRAWCAVAPRRRLAVGTMLFCAGYPLLLIGVNVAFGSYYSSWIWGSNLHRLLYLQHFQAANESHPIVRDAADIVQSPPKATTVPPIEPMPLPLVQPTERFVAPALPEPHMTSGRATWLMLRTMYRGFSPVYGLLCLVGVAVWWRVWLRIDHQALFYVCLITMVGIWFHSWEAKASSSRYALAIVVISAPFAALGLEAVVGLALRLRARFASTPSNLAASTLRLTGACVVVFAIASGTEIIVAHEPGGQAKHSLGTWMLESFGPDRHIVGTARFKLAGYYAHAHYEKLTASQALNELATNEHPDIFVLDKKGVDSLALARALAGLAKLDYREVETNRLPTPCQEEVVVLVRNPSQSR
jgi:hypothetical protein